jgi:MFS transporter, OFA family, oxalate/formate antiporter
MWIGPHWYAGRMTEPAVRGPGEFRRGWKVLIAALLGTACGASPIPFQTLGFFIGSLQEEFGWSLRDISVGLTIYGILGALLAPVFGSLADRFGVRPVALLSLTAFGIVFGCFAFTPNSLPGFYFLWVMVGLVGIGSTPITWSRAVNLWFHRNRGLALGLTLIGTSVTALVLPFLAVWLIAEFGWRMAYLLIALLPLGIALPVGLAWFREPRPEERPAELTAAMANGQQLPGVSLAQALHDRRFWLLLASIILIAGAYGGALVHMPTMLKARNFSGTQIATVMSLFGLAIFAGRIITGLLLDRFWAPLVTLPILSLPALACVMLAGDQLSFSMAIAAAFLLGFSSGAETDLVAYLASRYFGMAHYGKIYGSLYMGFGMASAISPTAYGWVRDSTGSYDPMLFAAAVFFVLGALLLLLLGRYPDHGGASPLE